MRVRRRRRGGHDVAGVRIDGLGGAAHLVSCMGIGDGRRRRHGVSGVRVCSRLTRTLSRGVAGLAGWRLVTGVRIGRGGRHRHLVSRMRIGGRRRRRGGHGVSGMRIDLSEGCTRRTGEQKSEERGPDHAAAPCIGRTLNT
jgi:hypothetical protein